MKPKDKSVTRVNAGSIAAEFVLAPGETEIPNAPAEFRTIAMRSQFDVATGQTRRAFRHVLKSDAQKKLRNKAARVLAKIELENKKATRAMFAGTNRRAFYNNTF